MIGEQSVNDLLGVVLLRLEEMVKLDEGSQTLLERAQSLQIELQDLGQELGHLVNNYDFDPEAIEAVTEHMNLWQELRRKYGGSVEAVLSKREELAQKIEIQGDLEGVLAKKRKASVDLEAELKKQAQKLTASRRKSAKLLSQKPLISCKHSASKRRAWRSNSLPTPSSTITVTVIANSSLPPTQDRNSNRSIKSLLAARPPA